MCHVPEQGGGSKTFVARGTSSPVPCNNFNPNPSLAGTEGAAKPTVALHALEQLPSSVCCCEMVWSRWVTLVCSCVIVCWQVCDRDSRAAYLMTDVLLPLTSRAGRVARRRICCAAPAGKCRTPCKQKVAHRPTQGKGRAVSPQSKRAPDGQLQRQRCGGKSRGGEIQEPLQGRGLEGCRVVGMRACRYQTYRANVECSSLAV